MTRPSRTYPHLHQKGAKWYAHLNIPPGARHAFDGKTLLAFNTGETDPYRAHLKALPVVRDWKARIAAAKAHRPDPTKTLVQSLADKFLRAHEDEELTREELVCKSMEAALEEVGGLQAGEAWHAMLAAKGSAEKAAKAVPHAAEAQAALQTMTGKTTPFLTYLDDWYACSHVALRGRDIAKADIQQFVRETGCTIETVSAGVVQKWIDGLLHPTAAKKPLTEGTIRHKLAGLRYYWDYLRSREIVDEDRRPFNGRRINGKESKVEKQKRKRRKWTPQQVVQLWQAAETNDPALACAIKIGAYTGLRREGIASLTAASVITDPATGVRVLDVEEKTAAGVRRVPIHSALAPLIDDLVARANGSLLLPACKNRYGKHGEWITRRFDSLKEKLGINDPRLVFHSIRKTLISQLQDLGCPENVCADIVGHEKPSLTYGLYGQQVDLRLQREWLEKVSYPETGQ